MSNKIVVTAVPSEKVAGLFEVWDLERERQFSVRSYPANLIPDSDRDGVVLRHEVDYPRGMYFLIPSRTTLPVLFSHKQLVEQFGCDERYELQLHPAL